MQTFNDGHGQTDGPGGMAVSPDGSLLFVTGGAGEIQSMTIAYDATTGAHRWLAVEEEGWFTSGLAVSPDGARVFVIGTWHCCARENLAAYAYDAATGRRLWARSVTRGPETKERSLGIAMSPDGSLVVGIASIGSCCTEAWLVVAFEADSGHIRWLRTFGTPPLYSRPSSAIVSPDGSVVLVTGFGTLQDETDTFTVAYDTATGATLWVQRFGAPDENDQGCGIDVAPDSSRGYVTETSFTATQGSDCAILSYELATGDLRRVDRVNGPSNGDDTCDDIEVSPDGAWFYTTGKTESESTGSDFLTLAYRA